MLSTEIKGELRREIFGRSFQDESNTICDPLYLKGKVRSAVCLRRYNERCEHTFSPSFCVFF